MFANIAVAMAGQKAKLEDYGNCCHLRNLINFLGKIKLNYCGYFITKVTLQLQYKKSVTPSLLGTVLLNVLTYVNFSSK